MGKTEQDALYFQVYYSLRDSILNGQLLEGQPLRSTELASRMNVSRMTVRNAIKQLQIDGLVEVVPNKSARVSPMAKCQIVKLYHLRKELEIKSIKMAVPFITSRDISRLISLNWEFEYGFRHTNIPLLIEIDREFHFTIHKRNNFPFLYETIEELWKRFPRYSYKVIPNNNKSSKFVSEHKSLIAALRKNQTDEAGRLMGIHVDGALNNFMERMGYKHKAIS